MRVFSEDYRRLLETLTEEQKDKIETIFEEWSKAIADEMFVNTDLQIYVDSSIKKYLDDQFMYFFEEAIQKYDFMTEIDWLDIFVNHDVNTGIDEDTLVSSDTVDEVVKEVATLDQDIRDVIFSLGKMTADIHTIKQAVGIEDKPKPLSMEEVIKVAMDETCTYLLNRGGKEVIIYWKTKRSTDVSNKCYVEVKFNKLVRITADDYQEFLAVFRERAKNIYKNRDIKKYFNATMENYAEKWIMEVIELEL